MEIRVNKFLRNLGLNSDDKGAEMLAEALMIPDLYINTKLSINVIDRNSDIVDVNRLDGWDMMELIAVKNKLERAIEKKEAIGHLENALERLNALEIQEIACNGYFVSKMVEVVPSVMNNEL